MRTLLLYTALFAAFQPTSLTAQSGALDLTFNSGDSGHGTGDSWDTPYALDIVQQPDGKFIVSGGFVRYNSIPRSRLARLNTDGSLDVSFNPGSAILSGEAYAVVLQPDGRIITAGQFTAAGANPTNIRRFEANGSTDNSFNVGDGFDQAVRDIVLQPDGKLIATGDFTSYNGTACHGIVRLNTDGSVDASFAPDNTHLFNGEQLALQADGKVLVAGYLYPQTKVARLNADGSLEVAFAPVVDQGSVSGVVLQPDGKLLISGTFSTVNGVARERLARLNPDGSLDATFDAGSGPDITTGISVTVQADGKAIVTGSFTSWNGQTSPGIIRLNDDGGFDPSFVAGTGFDRSSEVLLQSDGSLVCIGTFDSYQGHARSGLARLFPDGTLDEPFAPQHGIDSDVRALVVRPTGEVIAAGGFDAANGRLRDGIAQFHADGSLDEDLALEPLPTNDYWWSLALDTDGRLLACSQYTGNNLDQFGTVVRYLTDGSVDLSFDTGDGPDNHAYALALQADGKIIVGGAFTNFDGAGCGRIARLNDDGSVDANFDTGIGFDDRVWCVAVQPDGKVLVSGEFDTFNGTACDNLVRLMQDGSLDPSFNADNAAFTVRTFKLQPDGKVLYVSDNTVNAVRRLNTDGTADASFATIHITAGVAVSSIAVTATGQVIVGGIFEELNDIPAHNIALAHADGTLDPSFDSGSGFARPGSDLGTVVLALAVQPDERFLAGGTFNTYNGIGRNRLARINLGIASSIPGTTSSMLRAWPVPVEQGDELRIDLPQASSFATAFGLFDAAGRPVAADVQRQGTRVSVRTSTLAPGAYSFTATDPKARYKTRFVVR